MTIDNAFGSVTLGSVEFPSPQKYRPPKHPKRGSVIPGIQRTVTIQDFGRTARDAWFLLEGSGGQGLSPETVDAIDALADVQGATYTFADWLGNRATVWIAEFDYALSEQPTGWQLYDYTLRLKVVELVELRGAAYFGD